MFDQYTPIADINKKDFLKQVSSFSNQLSELIEAECTGFSSDSKEKKARIARAKVDFGFFAETYFPHYIGDNANKRSEFHQWCYEQLPQYAKDKNKGYKVAGCAPRGEGKSTIFTQLFSLWCIVFKIKSFIGIFMNAEDQAWAMLEVIKIELTENPRLAMDYPKATGQGSPWQVGMIVTANGIRVKTAGITKRVRGWRYGRHRPDLVLLDDLENDENVTSKEQRDKLERKIKRAILPIGPPDGTLDVFMIGTVLHYDSVLNRIMGSGTWRSFKFKAIKQWPDRMDLWQRWEEILLNQDEDQADAFYAKNKEVMDQGAVVSWPTMRPIGLLMKIRAEDHDAFSTEMQNEPADSENLTFQILKYWSEPSHGDWIYFGAVDPSLGKNNKKNDPSAILVGGMHRHTGVLDVIEADIRRRVPDLIIEDVIKYQAKYKIMAWAVEVVQFQEFLGTELVKRSAALGIPVPAVPVRPIADKPLRIESLQPHTANGLIRVHRNQSTLIEQLKFYGEADHDDGPDALEMLWQIAIQRMRGSTKIQTMPSSMSIDMRGFDVYVGH